VFSYFLGDHSGPAVRESHTTFSSFSKFRRISPGDMVKNKNPCPAYAPAVYGKKASN